MKGKIIAVILVMGLGDSWAAQGAVPNEYHGFWAAGSCSNPKYHFNIEASGIQGYGPDKRSPVGNWDIRETSRTAKGISFETPETNTGKKFHMELGKERQGWLTILVQSPDGTEETQFEICSPYTQ